MLSGPEGNKFSPWAVVNGQTFINDAFIQDGSVTNLKIGQYIMSNNYVVGMLGWKIDKSGNAEFNDVTIRGTVYATAGKFSGTIESMDGYFGGTIFANRIDGDISTRVGVENFRIGKNASKRITYVGNSRMDILLSIEITSIDSSMYSNANPRVFISVDGVIVATSKNMSNGATTTLSGFASVATGLANVPIVIYTSQIDDRDWLDFAGVIITASPLRNDRFII